MALVGDLKNINLGDIFQTLGMNRQIGTLIVRDGVFETRLFFSGGSVSLCSAGSSKKSRLGSFLVGEGLITIEQLLDALSRQKNSGWLLGDQIVALGLCEQEDIDEAVRYQAAAEIYTLFFWEAGEFEFIERPAPPPADAASPYAEVRFDPSAVVMEAARRVDEWSLVELAIPDDGEHFVRTGRPPPEAEEGFLSPRHEALLALLDGTRDVKSTYEEFHLARFDSGTILRELLEWDMIRPATTDELLESAWAFFDQRQPDRASRCLERAQLQDPSSVRVMELLAHCYEALEEQRPAADVLYRLGNLHNISGDTGEAVNALEKSARYDPANADSVSLLMRIYLELEDLDLAAENARTAARLLCDAQEYERCIEVIREALRALPHDLDLRIQLVNGLLGMGLAEKAVAELEELAAQLERSRDTRRLEEIYKKIVLLAPNKREYLRRLQRLQSGEASRRRKSLRLAAAIGTGVLVVVACILLFTSSSSAQETLSEAWGLFGSGQLEQAEQLANDVISSDPESDQAFEARNLLAAIRLRQSGGSGRKADARSRLMAALEARFTPAEQCFVDGKFTEGLRELKALVEFLEGPDCRGNLRQLSRRDADKVLGQYRKSVTDLFERYAEWLEKLASIHRAELVQIQDRSLVRAEIDTLKDQANLAARVRDAATGEDRVLDLEIAEAIEAALFAGERPLSARLRQAAQTLDTLRNDAEVAYHQTKAHLEKKEIYRDYEGALKEVNDLKYRGGLQRAREVCLEFLARCQALSRRTPSEVYAPVARELFDDDGLNADGKIQAELDRVDRVLESISRGNDLIRRRQYDEANAEFRTLLRENFRIDFSDHVRLVLHVRTRPDGAGVWTRWHDRPRRDHGITSADGILIRYHPYGETRLLVAKDSFEPVEIKISGFAADHPARLEMTLRKKLAWRSRSGVVQGSPALWGELILVPSRDGRIRAYDRATGELKLEHDTEILSGLAFSPLVSGDSAYLSTPANDLIAVDLENSTRKWTFSGEAPLSASPVLIGDLVVVTDQDGRVYAVRDGSRVWTRPLTGRCRSSPVTCDGSVYVTTTEGRVYKLDARTGEVEWQRDLGAPVYGSPVLAPGGLLLVATEAPVLVALSCASGEAAWRTPLEDAPAGSPMFFGDRVWAVTLRGKVLGIDPDDGEIRSRGEIGGERTFKADPVHHDGRIYLVSTLGNLVGFSQEQGVLWSFELGEPVSGGLLVHASRLFVATDRGTVLSFDIAHDGPPR